MHTHHAYERFMNDIMIELGLVWLPHVTVAHQVPRRKVPEAMAELGGIPGSFFATQLRYVDTRAHEAQSLVGVSSSVL